MKTYLLAAWYEDDGVLSFEWVLMITCLVIGIIGGLAAARDAIIDELGDAAEAMLALDQSYAVDNPLGISVHTPDITSTASDSVFTDFAVFEDCDRGDLEGQPASP